MFKCLPCFNFIATGSCGYSSRCKYIHDTRISNHVKTTTRLTNNYGLPDAFYYEPDYLSIYNYSPTENSQSSKLWFSFIKNIQFIKNNEVL